MCTSRFLAATASIALLLAAGLPALCPAATLRVPSEYATIQEAIDAAEGGDTILIADGIYSGSGNRDLSFGGKDLIVRSENGAEATVIDCGGTANEPHRGFHLHEGETLASLIEGLTIRHGFTHMPGGAGILCDGASPVIRRCVLLENTVDTFGEDGGGLLLRDSSSLVEDCDFLANLSSYGGAIACRSASQARIERCRIEGNIAHHGAGIDAGGTSSVAILDCTIAGNEAVGYGGSPGFGGGLVLGGDVTVEGCTITGNASGGGSGVAAMAGESRIVHSTFAGNRAVHAGGGFMAFGSAVTVERSVFWNNCAPAGPTGVSGSGSTMSFTCSIFDEGGILPNGGVIVDLGQNLAEDPLFCGPALCDSAPTTEGDYTVSSSSSCVPAQSPCGDWIGSKPIGCPVTEAPDEEVLADARTVVLGPVHPNPVRGSLRADLRLAGASACFAEIVDVQGRRVAIVLDEALAPGAHRLEWSASNRLPSGAYYLVLRAAGLTEKRSFLLLPAD